MRDNLGKLSCMWGGGLFLGVKGSTGQFIIGTADGVWTTRAIQRKPKEQHWISSRANLIGEIPWWTTDDDPKVDGEALRCDIAPGLPLAARETASGASVPRRFAMTKSDLDKHGYTAKCVGCMSILWGTARQTHTTEYCTRMDTAMRGDPKVENAKRRADEYFDKVLEAEGEEAKRRRTLEQARDASDDVMQDSPQDSAPAAEQIKRPRAEEDDETEHVDKKMRGIMEICINHEDDIHECDQGEELPAKLVAEAAAEEVAFMRGLHLYAYVPLQGCYDNAGKAPISTGWVRTNTGTAEVRM